MSEEGGEEREQRKDKERGCRGGSGASESVPFASQ